MGRNSLEVVELVTELLAYFFVDRLSNEEC